jgi:hypothetical protein
MRAVSLSLVPVVLAAVVCLAMPQKAAACLAYSPNTDTADFEGPPHNVLLATATTGGPPDSAPITFSDVVALRGRTPNRLRLGPSDSWSCHPPYFKRGDRVLILEWGRLPLSLPLVWRVGPPGEILPGVIYSHTARPRVVRSMTFTPLVDGQEPKTLADVLTPFGIDVPDSAMLPPARSPATPIGLAFVAAAFALLAIRRWGPSR